ncbi:GntR family transcriptional regulator [soil metagenome]
MVVDTPIDRGSDRPAYKQIADLLRDPLESGQVGPGDRLPSESDLMAATGVSRATVRRGLDVLIQEGRAESRPGEGVFAVGEPMRLTIRDPVETLAGGVGRNGLRRSMRDDAEAQGFEYRQRLVDSSEIDAPDDVADALDVPRGTRVYARQRVVSLRAPGASLFAPAKLGDSYYPLQFATAARSGGDDTTGTRGIHGGIARAGYEPTRYEERVLFRMPTPSETRRLRLKAGVPVIDQLRIVFADDVRVECFVAISASDKYQLEYRIPVS